MLQIFSRQSDLDTMTIDDIRRQIGFGLLIIAVIVGLVVNTATISAGVSLSGESSFLGFGLAAVAVLGLFLLYRKFMVNFALHLPLLLLIPIVLTTSDPIRFVAILFPMIGYSAIITRLPIYVGLSLVTFMISIIRQQQATSDFPYLLFTVIAVIVGTLVFYVIYNLENITRLSNRTNRLLKASANVGQVINQELELQQLLDKTVDIVRSEYDFYHVQVFLIDEQFQYANLVASTGTAGEKLLARNHRLPVGSQSVIGRVTQVGEPVVAQNTSLDTVHAVNEILPDTRAELALPIMDSGNIIGALDVQSVNADAFQPIDIQALQIIASQLAVAIRNMRLFEQAQQNIQQNNRILFEYETNLREVDRLNRTLTKQSWDSYLAQTYVDGVTLSGNRFVPQAEWSNAMRKATAQGNPQIVTNDDRTTITIPIVLRGQVLGAVEVEIGDQNNPTESLEIIQAISQRLAISLESARLFEETQEASLQEQQINDIVSSYETAVTVDELLQLTLEKLQDSLGADKGTIRLGTVNTVAPPDHKQNGNGGSPS